MDKLIKKITSIAEERFEQSDLSDCFLVDIDINGKKLEVFIDSDTGVHFGQCQKLSRAIEEYLDESQVLGEKYTLEVSSPGVDRPLKYKRQYFKHKDRKIETRLKDGTLIQGTLTAVEDDHIEVTATGGKKKKKETEVHTIGYQDIDESKILITFSK